MTDVSQQASALGADAGSSSGSLWVPEDAVVQLASTGASDTLELSSLAAAQAHAWPTTSLAMEGLAFGHDTLGMPWWASIAAFSLTMRAAVFPLQYLMKLRRRQVLAQQVDPEEHARVIDKETAEWVANPELSEAVKAECLRMANALKEEHRQLARVPKHDATATLLLLSSGVLVRNLAWFSMYSGVTLMAWQMPSLACGGTLWFPDLTAPDSTLGLTLLSGGMLMGATQRWLRLETEGEPPQELAHYLPVMNSALRFGLLAAWLVPAGLYLPSATMWLLVCDTTIASVQARVVRTLALFQMFFRVRSLADAADKRKEQGGSSGEPAAPPPAPPPSAGPPGSAASTSGPREGSREESSKVGSPPRPAPPSTPHPPASPGPSASKLFKKPASRGRSTRR